VGVEALLGPHALGAGSGAAGGAPSSRRELLARVEAAPVPALSTLGEFVGAHSFLRALFGHEEVLAALQTDGTAWKQLRMLARVATSAGGERVAHFAPFVRLTDFLADLNAEAEIVDRLGEYASRTLERCAEALDAVASERNQRALNARLDGGGAAPRAAGGRAATAASTTAAAALSSHPAAEAVDGADGADGAGRRVRAR
jgi:hypothetical protein